MDIISELSTRLLKFKKTGNSYTFRCPYCGDSASNSYKTRGYLFKTKIGNYAIKCHNCQISKSLNNFLKDNFPDLFREYIYKNFKNLEKSEIIKSPPPIYKPEIFENYPTISQLHKEHPYKKYLESRKLPNNFYKEVFYIEKFKSFCNKHKHTYNNLENEESRIVVPLIIGGDVIGWQGRCIGNIGVRYITIMLGDYPKVYNIDNIDWKKPVYVTEGIYDSLFVPNCIAMLGSYLNFDFLKQYKDTEFRFIYDNEPYSRQIINQMISVVNNGYKVCVWGKNIKQKDLNDCFLAGVDFSPLLHNHYHSIRAKLEIKTFAKI